VSQLSKQKVEKSADVLDLGQECWVKVIKVEHQEVPPGAPPRAKVSLSLKLVAQLDGTDLDPENIELENDERKRKPREAPATNHSQPNASTDAAHGGTCSRCGGRGHHASECFNPIGGSKYDLVATTDGDTAAMAMAAVAGGERKDKDKDKDKNDRKKAKAHKKAEKKAAKKAARQERKLRKKEKKGKKEKRKRRDTSSSSSRDSSADSGSESGDDNGPQPAPALAAFVASAQFAGKRAGFVFHNGPQGVGYYLDR